MFNQLRCTVAPLPADEVATAYAPFGDFADAAPPRVRRPGGLRLGAGQHLLRVDVPGSRGVFAEPGAQTSVETGAGGVLLCAGRTASCARSQTSAAIVATKLVACGVSANKRSIVCPYHGWNYKLDGSLRTAPGGFRDLEGFDKSQFGLVEAERRGVARLGVRRPER